MLRSDPDHQEGSVTPKRSHVLALALAALAAAPAAAQQLAPRPPGRHWQAIVLPGGDTLRFTVWVPPGIGGGARVPLVLAAHFGGRVTPYMGGEYLDILVLPALESLGAVIVAPDARRPTGWSTDDDERLVWLIQEMKRIYPIDPAKVVMTGFSAGGAQTWRFANAHQDLLAAAIPVAAPVREAPPRPWTIPVYVLHSTADERFEIGPVRDYVAAQRAAGAPLELHTVDGIPHNRTPLFADGLSEAVGWLRERWK
jgi:poly(3-hydroxybutyrate) depolymerase